MVKRATIHVSSRTKKNHPKYRGIREIESDNKYNMYNITTKSCRTIQVVPAW